MRGVGLADRIRWILKTRGWKQRELSRRAKLKSQSHVGLILKSGSAKIEALNAIAEAAGVPFVWLANGEGTPEGPIDAVIDFDDRYRNRAEAVARLRGVVRQETIAWLVSRRLQSDNRDQSIKQWMDDALTHERHVDKFGDVQGPDPEDDV